MKRILMYFAALFLLVLFSSIMIPELFYRGRISVLKEEILFSDGFRSQPVSLQMEAELRECGSPGEYLAVSWVENGFLAAVNPLSPDEAAAAAKRWNQLPGWAEYVSACRAVWDDLVYFPVAGFPEETGLFVSYEDSWLYERTYGGQRRHEGTDIMPSVNKSGLFPVISMTDGTVENKGWLKLGGYRIGIKAPSGAYFYYAHLHSYGDLEIGDTVEAGDYLGLMGDTGYGTEEGTRGKFPVHLHVGIYLYPENREVSVNPYPALRYLDSRKISADKHSGNMLYYSLWRN